MDDQYAAESAKYKEWLRSCRETASNSYDKAILTLSASALALPTGFLRSPTAAAARVLQWRGWLVVAWVCFTTAMFSTLISFLTSHRSHDRALNDLEMHVDRERIYEGRPGGLHATITDVLNYAALVLLLAGVISFALFVWKNLERIV
jgi:hypothetical protein